MRSLRALRIACIRCPYPSVRLSYAVYVRRRLKVFRGTSVPSLARRHKGLAHNHLCFPSVVFPEMQVLLRGVSSGKSPATRPNSACASCNRDSNPCNNTAIERQRPSTAVARVPSALSTHDKCCAVRRSQFRWAARSLASLTQIALRAPRRYPSGQ